jgi:hypothetical protein
MVKLASGITLEELERETGKLASDLAFYARRPVNIQMVAGKHIAFTYDTDKTKKAIPVVMNPSVLEKIRNKERALRIWRGIGYHELLHHLHPADAQYKQAYKEGFGHLFNLVDDEQNERRGRALNADWGSCFQSVCAHIFPSKEREVISTGIIDGGVAERKPVGMSADKVYTKRWSIFAYHFRRHIPGCLDPVVAEALGLIPANFKDLSKEDLFCLTREIHRTLAKGIEMPPHIEPEPIEDDEEEPKKKEPQKKEDEKDEEEEPPPPPPPTVWSLKRLLKNKWMYVPFALFLLGWTFLFLRQGVDFWVQVAVFGGVSLLALGVFLYMRRAYIKALLQKAKESLKPGAGPPTAPAKQKAIFGIGITIVLLALVFFLIWKLHLPPLWYYLTGAVMWFASSLAVANLLSKRAEEKKERVSIWLIVPMVLMCLGSIAALAWCASEFGLGRIWLGILGGILMLAPLGLCLFLLGSGTEKWGGRASIKERIKRGFRPIGEAIKAGFFFIVEAIWKVIGPPIVWTAKFVWKVISTIALSIWGKIVAFAQWLWYWIRRGYWKSSPYVIRMWRNPIFRLALITMPIAAIGCILYAIAVKAVAVSWWLLALLIALLLLLLLLLFLFRKQISKFILSELFMPMPDLMGFFVQPPLDMTTDWFVQIDDVVPVEPDQGTIDELLPQTFVLAAQLRKYLAECGSALVDREDQPDGHDLIDEAELALIGESNIFIEDERYPKASVHLEVALDCSSSMNSATLSLGAGEKFRLGKLFAMVLEQAVINLPNVSAHFWGFTSDKIYDCGVAGERRVSGLVCNGGNNDAAMLWKMGQSAKESGKDVKILLMLSDGQPSECSWLALRNLVVKFEQEGMIPWNFALDVIRTPAFERFFTDLVGQTQDEAVMTMGQILASIAQTSNEN